MGDVIGMPGIEQVGLKQKEVTWSDARCDLEIALAHMIRFKGVDEVECVVGQLLDIAWAAKEHSQNPAHNAIE